MSLFLGPIHQWLYDKIIFQEDLTDALIDAGRAEGWSELTEELANECHSYDRRPLEENCRCIELICEASSDYRSSKPCKSRGPKAGS